MTRLRLSIALAVAASFAPAANAIEILRWERLPLAVPLHVDQERVIFIDRNVRVGVPPSIGQRLRVQSAAGAIYLRASEPIEPTRIQLQDADSGALILLDIAAEVAPADQTPLEPVRIVEGETAPIRYGDLGAATEAEAAKGDGASAGPARETPVAVVLTRYAAQNLFAPLRTVEPVAGVTRMNLKRGLALDMLLPTLPVRATALAAWRLDAFQVTAVRLKNTSKRWVTLDPREVQGDFVTATFQHDALGPAGTPDDTSVVYLVTKGRSLAESLLPVVGQISTRPSRHTVATRKQEDRHEK
ncbi:TIGR03749 family integrating conjugative element protein [Shinella sp.]|uniref:TIGR03749 family integrating conjugative element protein n=1 Tax=Shinella sp. TaxID=1870904 RepID=UPI00258CE6FC|nr:TIGR03749 family integrating conjugative element protein [Shinella sp.]MCW5706951.1 TIGR03749 family integrating conjugative element protein [Shinella sp.]